MTYEGAEALCPSTSEPRHVALKAEEEPEVENLSELS